MEPILLDVPEEITTERLRLRAPRFGDGALINKAIVESATELARWMPWANPTPPVENTETWCRTAVSKFASREQFDFLYFRKADDVYLGTLGLHLFDWAVPKAELGYWIRTSQSRHGYVTEATQALTQFAFESLKLNRVVIRCDTNNARSRRVAELAGYTLEGIHRNEAREHSNLRDTCIFARLPNG